MKELACKPDFVVDSHSSRRQITLSLKQSTQKPPGRTNAFLFDLAPSGVFTATPVTSCAVRSYRTISTLLIRRNEFSGIFSAALSVGSRPPVIIWHSAQWSPDFPPFYHYNKTATAQPTLSRLV